eukprot:3166829-Alexandrium_andersonii.AAC.1
MQQEPTHRSLLQVKADNRMCPPDSNASISIGAVRLVASALGDNSAWHVGGPASPRGRPS